MSFDPVVGLILVVIGLSIPIYTIFFFELVNNDGRVGQAIVCTRLFLAEQAEGCWRKLCRFVRVQCRNVRG